LWALGGSRALPHRHTVCGPCPWRERGRTEECDQHRRETRPVRQRTRTRGRRLMWTADPSPPACQPVELINGFSGPRCCRRHQWRAC
jgi:hypothetical protein